jgi:hypothetical protein
MKTSQKQISLFTENQLISLPVDSHANHTQAQVSDLGKRTSDTSGRTCSEQFQRLSQPTLWAKMFVGLLIGTGEWSSKRCALTWKVKGTPYNRYYCQLVPLAHRTGEIEFGSLLPTPTTQETPHYNADLTNTSRRKASNGNTHSLNLADHAIRGLLPTPTVFDSTNASATMKSSQVKEGSMHSMTLPRMLSMGMLPTPTAQIIKHGHSEKYWNNRIGKRQMDLSMWNAETNGKTSQLNPQFVAEMMGFPPNWTELPFLNGETKV